MLEHTFFQMLEHTFFQMLEYTFFQMLEHTFFQMLEHTFAPRTMALDPLSLQSLPAMSYMHLRLKWTKPGFMGVSEKKLCFPALSGGLLLHLCVGTETQWCW